VVRPPQELMRGLGKKPILKASRPNHGLGIQAISNLVEEGKKGSVVGRGRPAGKKMQRRERKLLGPRKD
jgi:hypothetical protein